MTDLLTVGGDSGGGFGSAAGGGLVGGLVGSWFGNGNGFGGFGGNSFGAGFATSILNDGINAIQNSINGMNMNLSSGLCNIGYQTLDQSSRNQMAMMQGFSSIAHDNCQSTNSVVSAINNLGFQNQQCCCDLKRLIADEGAATRGLMQQNLINKLQYKLADEKAENATLKSQMYQTNLSNAQTGAILAAIRGITPTTTPATAG